MQNTAIASQTLIRGLDVLEAVAQGRGLTLLAMTAKLGLTRSTAHRLAAALVDRRYLKFTPGKGYCLGPKLLELGYRMQQQMDLPRIARPHLEALASRYGDSVYLGVLDGQWALYLDKIPGRQGREIGAGIGGRHPLWSTALGKALILDESPGTLARFFRMGEPPRAHDARDREAWLARMADDAARGLAFDREEAEPQIRGLGAPIRDAEGKIIAAVSLCGAAWHMTDAYMDGLAAGLRKTAEDIARVLAASPKN